MGLDWGLDREIGLETGLWGTGLRTGVGTGLHLEILAVPEVYKMKE